MDSDHDSDFSDFNDYESDSEDSDRKYDREEYEEQTKNINLYFNKPKSFILDEIAKVGGHILEFVSFDLRNDKEVVLAAVNRTGFALADASEKLKNDKEIVLIAVKHFGIVLQYASFELRNDKDVVLTAVKQDGWALKHTSEELQNNEEIVLAAVKQTGWGLEYASNELKNNKKIILAAIENNIDSIKYASGELQKIWNENGSFMNKKYLVCENNTSCLISMCEIKEEDSYYKCSNEKIEQCHYYLKESFDEWRKLGKSNKCVYCFAEIIDTVFVNSDN